MDTLTSEGKIGPKVPTILFWATTIILKSPSWNIGAFEKKNIQCIRAAFLRFWPRLMVQDQLL